MQSTDAQTIWMAHGDTSTGYNNFKIYAISEELTVVPVPGAVLLGMLGLSFAGMKLRKHA